MKQIKFSEVKSEEINFRKIIALPIDNDHDLKVAMQAMSEAESMVNNLRKSTQLAVEHESLIANKAACYAVRTGLAKPIKSYRSWNDPDYHGNDATYQWTYYEVKVGQYELHITQTCKDGKWIYLWS